MLTIAQDLDPVRRVASTRKVSPGSANHLPVILSNGSRSRTAARLRRLADPERARAEHITRKLNQGAQQLGVADVQVDRGAGRGQNPGAPVAQSSAGSGSADALPASRRHRRLEARLDRDRGVAVVGEERRNIGERLGHVRRSPSEGVLYIIGPAPVEAFGELGDVLFPLIALLDAMHHGAAWRDDLLPRRLPGGEHHVGDPLPEVLRRDLDDRIPALAGFRARASRPKRVARLAGLFCSRGSRLQPSPDIGERLYVCRRGRRGVTSTGTSIAAAHGALLLLQRGDDRGARSCSRGSFSAAW